MKGGVRLFRVRGRHFPLLLLVLIFTTILFWIWEKTPFTNTLLLTKDQFLLHSSELVYDVRIDSLTSVKQEDEAKEEVENSLTLEKSTGGQISDVNYIDSTTSLNSANSKTDPRTSSSSKIKVCNYAKGRWVADNKRPLYSGRGCKQWLSDMWACRLTQRTDFSYEGFRWQPDNCEMPEFDRFTFLKRMRDKTIAFIGDSLGRQQFQSLMCMLSGGEEMPEVQDIGKEYGLLVNPGQLRPDGWAFRFPTTNTTVLYYWSATLCDLEPLNITNSSTEVAMHLDRPPSFMNRFFDRFNVLVLNTGHHWNRGKLNANRWVMYVNGKHNTDRKLAAIGNAKNFTVHSIARWVDSQLPSHPRLKAFFRTISPRHFHNGEWNTGGSCDGITPLAKGSSVTKDESSDVVIESAVKGTRVKILDITSISELRDEAHIARFSVKASVGINDCLHWCLPGIPDTWNEVLCAQVL